MKKPKLPNLTLPQNRSRLTQGHHLNKLWWAGVPDATYQVSWKSACRLQRRRFWRVFTLYGRGSHFGHVTSIMSTNFRSPTQWGSTQNLALIGQAVLQKKMFEIVNDGRRRTPDHGYTISSPLRLWLRWAKNKKKNDPPPKKKKQKKTKKKNKKKNSRIPKGAEINWSRGGRRLIEPPLFSLHE